MIEKIENTKKTVHHAVIVVALLLIAFKEELFSIVRHHMYSQLSEAVSPAKASHKAVVQLTTFENIVLLTVIVAFYLIVENITEWSFTIVVSSGV